METAMVRVPSGISTPRGAPAHWPPGWLPSVAERLRQPVEAALGGVHVADPLEQVLGLLRCHLGHHPSCLLGGARGPHALHDAQPRSIAAIACDFGIAAGPCTATALPDLPGAGHVGLRPFNTRRRTRPRPRCVRVDVRRRHDLGPTSRSASTAVAEVFSNRRTRARRSCLPWRELRGTCGSVEHPVVEHATALAGASNLAWIRAQPLGRGDRIWRHAQFNTRLLSEIPGTVASGSDLHPVIRPLR